MLDPFQLEFVQRGLLEILVFSVAAGLLGTWIVLRGLAFYSHAVAAAAFPGLVLADGLSFSAPLGAFAVAALFAAGVGRLSASRRAGYDSLTALALVAALAAGVILASDGFQSRSRGHWACGSRWRRTCRLGRGSPCSRAPCSRWQRRCASSARRRGAARRSRRPRPWSCWSLAAAVPVAANTASSRSLRPRRRS